MFLNSNMVELARSRQLSANGCQFQSIVVVRCCVRRWWSEVGAHALQQVWFSLFLQQDWRVREFTTEPGKVHAHIQVYLQATFTQGPPVAQLRLHHEAKVSL